MALAPHSLWASGQRRTSVVLSVVRQKPDRMLRLRTVLPIAEQSTPIMHAMQSPLASMYLVASQTHSARSVAPAALVEPGGHALQAIVAPCPDA